ncbi:putative Ig domain-containing protein [Streptomyces sp. NPDC096311]|uniref:putative Ig domain-containing protein n=1 Tax=Streptomyces sp. NPDC096311 TaxID=3366083 RepID=UPI0038056329
MRPRRSWAVVLVTALLAAFVPLVTAFATPAVAATVGQSAAASAGDDSGLMTDTLVTINSETSSAGFSHPGIGLTASDFTNARRQVRAGVEPWKSYFDAMLKTSYSSKTLTSKNGSTVLDQPGTDAFTNVGTESKLIDDSMGAYTQAILYYITGDDVYRANAMKIIRIWSHMNPDKYAYYADSQIHTGVPLYRLLSAAELLRYTSYNDKYTDYNLAWTDADTANLTKNLITPMTATFLYKNTNYFNQHSYPLVGALAGYIFTDNRARYSEGVEWFTVNATSTKQDINGAIAGIFKKVDKKNPLNPYGYSFVQHQEMGRDQAHAGGDVDTLAGLARIVSTQGTKVDPVKGTPSAAKNAVSPFRFLDDRLLAGANAYARYMLGYQTPWVDLSGGPGMIAGGYRGRLAVLSSISELYDIYTYQEKVDVEKEAPYLALAHREANGPLFYRGGTLTNFWGGVDTGPEYWLAFPSKLAGQVPRVAVDANVQVETKSVAFDSHTKIKTEGDRIFARVKPSAKGSLLAVHDLEYSDRTKYSPVALMIRTSATSTLEIAKDQTTAPFHTMTLPNTHGQWRNVTYDMSYSAAPVSRSGDNIAYYEIIGKSHSPVDIDYVNVLAGTQLSKLAFPQGDATTVLGVQGAALSTSLAATDSNSADTVTYEGDGLPSGARLDPATGELSWTPSKSQAGVHDLLVVASNGTVDTVLKVRVDVAQDRASAYTKAQAGYDAGQKYTSASLTAFQTASDAAKAAIPAATDADFLASLVQLQKAVAGLQLLSPLVADDGSLNYPSLATSSLTPDTLRNLVDGDYNTTTGDLTAPFTLDFGAGFRVQASAFGLQARYMFANRSMGANVYGSNDGQSWTLLTAHETTDTTAQNYAMETIPVRSEVKDQSFRFFKVQVDDPGVPNDPAYPGLSSFGEVRIHGTRIETVQALSSVKLSSDDAVAGQAVNGDTVTLDLVATQPLDKVDATIEGVAAKVTSTDSQHWQATAVLPDDVDYGRALRFTAEYTTADGRTGATVFQTTDGSSLQLWNTHVKVAGIKQAWVDASTPQWPGTGTTAANGWRMFDGDITTSTDTTTSNGWVTVVPTDGSALTFDAVRVHPRSGYASRANGTVLQSSTDGGATWQTVLTISGVTSDQQWYTFTPSKRQSIPMLRVLDDHGGNTDVAEVQLLQFDQLPD